MERRLALGAEYPRVILLRSMWARAMGWTVTMMDSRIGRQKIARPIVARSAAIRVPGVALRHGVRERALGERKEEAIVAAVGAARRVNVWARRSVNYECATQSDCLHH